MDPKFGSVSSITSDNLKDMASDLEQNKNIRKPSKFLYLAAASALLGAIGMGCVLGWTAPAFDDMDRIDSEPHIKSDDKEIKSWIGSSMTLGALVGALSSGPIAQLFGRKIALITYGIPMVVGWFLIFIAKSVPLIMIGRILTGICAGLISGTAPSYVVEISTVEIRGLLGTLFQVCVTIGILMVYVFGSFLSWNWLAFVSLIPGLLMSIAMILMPETPIWLLTNSKDCDHSQGSKAEKALSQLRDIVNDNESELNEMAHQAKASKKESGFSMQQMKNPIVYKPFLLAMGLMFFQQFSGINAVMFYATNIFRDSGSSIKPSLCTIIIGVAQVIATIVGSLLVDRLGRKILLIASGVGHSLSLAVMGIYYYQSSQSSVSSLGWLPVVCLVVFIISFSIGFGPIPWLMIAEITPISARSMISAVATAFNWLSAFIIVKNFEWLQEVITKHGTFFLFAAFCVLSVLFAFFLLPETKGKSMEEIQAFFGGNKSRSESSTPSASNAMLKPDERKGSDVGINGPEKPIELKNYDKSNETPALA